MMKTYRVEIPERIVSRSFERALSYPEHSRGTFFYDLRRAFNAELEAIFVRHVILVNRIMCPSTICVLALQSSFDRRNSSQMGQHNFHRD